MTEKKKDELFIHMDFAEQDPSIPEKGPDVCPTCGKPLESGYGMAGGGMGVYMYCEEHGIISKTQTD